MEFKLTSQANHLSKLLSAKSEMWRENTHAQRLYKRRKQVSDGHIVSNWSSLNTSVINKIPAQKEEKYRPENEIDEDYYWIPIDDEGSISSKEDYSDGFH